MRLSLVVPCVALATLAMADRASAGPCPTVMIILDRSGSMDADPAGNYSSPPSKLDIAKVALDKLVMQYGDRLPFGLTVFASTGLACSDGVDVLVKPIDGTKADITTQLAAVMTTGSTNTGPAIDAVAALPEMHDTARPGSYILLVTDGEPNCPGNVGTESTDPAYTVGAVARAKAKGIETFVIGFGALPTEAKMAMNMMATAGGVPCSGSACNGQLYYAAEDDAGLQAAIDSISQQIFGEFGGLCDDSCYANGCPNAGEICVQNKCVLDPCLTVRNTCAPGDYCYTDGTSPGSCTPACPQACPPGNSCTISGTCTPDPCSGIVCQTGEECVNGLCQPASCKNCPSNLFCVDGKCKDDPCRFITCPMGATCQTLKGTCIANEGTGAGHRDRGDGGCHFAPGEHPDQMMLVAGLVLLAGALMLRRRARR